MSVAATGVAQQTISAGLLNEIRRHVAQPRPPGGVT